jgi:hypothetical protein
MTGRQTKVVNVVRRAIEELLANRMHKEIGENTTMQSERLSDATRRLRPDLNFVLASMCGTRFVVMMDISCPYGRIAHGENTVQKVSIDRLEKYEQMAQEVKEDRDMPVDIIPVIVSSIWVIHEQSPQDLGRRFLWGEKEMKRIGRRLSEAAVARSIEIWKRYGREVTQEEDPQIGQVYAQEALKAGEKQEGDNQDDESDKQAKSTESEPDNLADEMEIEPEEAQEAQEEVQTQDTGTEINNSEAESSDMQDFM